MDKYCIGCRSKSKSYCDNADWFFCLDERTYKRASGYSASHGGRFKINKDNIPSCMLVQSAYDGECPYKDITQQNAELM